jgi:hypothetical protein
MFKFLACRFEGLQRMQYCGGGCSNNCAFVCLMQMLFVVVVVVVRVSPRIVEKGVFG